jgi:hypothetical protein
MHRLADGGAVTPGRMKVNGVLFLFSGMATSIGLVA